MVNQHRPQESLNKFAYVHWSLCLNVRCWLLWCTHQTFGAHQTFLLSVPAIEEWTHSWRSKLAQGSSDTCWNSSCFHQTFLPRPKHGIITPNNDRTLNILDGKKNTMLASQALFVNWSVTGWEANNPTHPNGLLPKSSISPLDLRSLSNEGHTFAIHFAVYPHKAHESIAQYNTRNQLQQRTNQNVEMLWKFREMKGNILCISNKSNLMQFESLWNLTWLSRYI